MWCSFAGCGGNWALQRESVTAAMASLEAERTQLLQQVADQQASFEALQEEAKATAESASRAAMESTDDAVQMALQAQAKVQVRFSFPPACGNAGTSCESASIALARNGQMGRAHVWPRASFAI